MDMKDAHGGMYENREKGSESDGGGSSDDDSDGKFRLCQVFLLL